MKILVLGVSGMAGHTIYLYLKEKGYSVEGISRQGVPFLKSIVLDVSDRLSLKQLIEKNDYDAIINCVGILNESATRNKDLAVYINSYLPHYLAKLVVNKSTRIIHLSTDCVFSGLNGPYLEDDFKDGNTFYDRTKSLGELNDNQNLTFRNSIIGPDVNKDGIGLFNWFMKQSEAIVGYSEVFWAGVTTLTLAKAIEKALQDNITGLYQLSNNNPISKYELLNLFNQEFKKKSIQISRNNAIKSNKALICSRDDFSFLVPDYLQMISEMNEWISTHKNQYPHYFYI